MIAATAPRWILWVMLGVYVVLFIWLQMIWWDYRKARRERKR